MWPLFYKRDETVQRSLAAAVEAATAMKERAINLINPAGALIAAYMYESDASAVVRISPLDLIAASTGAEAVSAFFDSTGAGSAVWSAGGGLAIGGAIDLIEASGIPRRYQWQTPRCEIWATVTGWGDVNGQYVYGGYEDGAGDILGAALLRDSDSDKAATYYDGSTSVQSHTIGSGSVTGMRCHALFSGVSALSSTRYVELVYGSSSRLYTVAGTYTTEVQPRTALGCVPVGAEDCAMLVTRIW